MHERPDSPKPRSPCALANALDLFGDRWTLLIVRDIVLGKHRFADLQASHERIPTNILADRLKRLGQHGLVDRRCYQERPRRFEYHLTAKGRDLLPVLQSMAHWGRTHMPGTYWPGEGALTADPDDLVSG